MSDDHYKHAGPSPHEEGTSTEIDHTTIELSTLSSPKDINTSNHGKMYALVSANGPVESLIMERGLGEDDRADSFNLGDTNNADESRQNNDVERDSQCCCCCCWCRRKSRRNKKKKENECDCDCDCCEDGWTWYFCWNGSSVSAASQTNTDFCDCSNCCRFEVDCAEINRSIDNIQCDSILDCRICDRCDCDCKCDCDCDCNCCCDD